MPSDVLKIATEMMANDSFTGVREIVAPFLCEVFNMAEEHHGIAKPVFANATDAEGFCQSSTQVSFCAFCPVLESAAFMQTPMSTQILGLINSNLSPVSAVELHKKCEGVTDVESLGKFGMNLFVRTDPADFESFLEAERIAIR